MAPLQLVALDAGQIDRAALAGVGRVGAAVLGVQRAHAQLFRAIGQLLQHVAHLHAAGMHGAGGHGTHAIQAEHAVDGQAETRLGRKCCGGFGRFCRAAGSNDDTGAMGTCDPVRTMRRIQPCRLGAQQLAQFDHAVTAGGRNGDDGCVGQGRVGQQRCHLLGHLLHAGFIHPVDLGDGHHAAVDAQE